MEDGSGADPQPLYIHLYTSIPHRAHLYLPSHQGTWALAMPQDLDLPCLACRRHSKCCPRQLLVPATLGQVEQSQVDSRSSAHPSRLWRGQGLSPCFGSSFTNNLRTEARFPLGLGGVLPAILLQPRVAFPHKNDLLTQRTVLSTYLVLPPKRMLPEQRASVYSAPSTPRQKPSPLDTNMHLL